MEDIYSRECTYSLTDEEKTKILDYLEKEFGICYGTENSKVSSCT
jgi:hypothetical protein